jgi:DNA-binding MarR family transcriptional regulator
LPTLKELSVARTAIGKVNGKSGTDKVPAGKVSAAKTSARAKSAGKLPAGKPGAAEDEAEMIGFVLEDFLPYQLAVTATRVSRLFARRYADDFGISIPEWRVLTVVGREAGISPSAVSERAKMDKVKVSRATATLVSRGLIKQTQDPVDGRARMLRLTRRGQSTLRSLVPVAQELEDKLAGTLSRAEWASLRQTLSRLNSQVPDVDGPPID